MRKLNFRIYNKLYVKSENIRWRFKKYRKECDLILPNGIVFGFAVSFLLFLYSFSFYLLDRFGNFFYSHQYKFNSRHRPI